jgi:aerobic carbon-monoxide dehydrogenase large subunit
VRDDECLALSGQAHYTTDLAAHAPVVVFLRCPYPVADLHSVDTRAARLLDGVLGVFDSASLGHPVMPLPNPGILALPDPKHLLLADRQASYLGQPVVAIVARNTWIAQDAAEAIMIDYEPCEVPTTAGGVAPHASVVFGDHQAAQASAALAPGGITVSISHQQPRLAPFAMEPRAIVARWEGDSARLICHAATQAPARARDHIAQVCGLAVDQVQVLCAQVGGAFGAKASLSPEELLVALIARHMRSTLRWCATRSEEFLAAPQGRGAGLNAQLVIDEQGQIRSLQATLDFELGGWWPYSACVPARNAARILPGPYLVQALGVKANIRSSARAATGIYRGAGRPEAALLMEALLDKAARAIGCDPLDIRRRNVLASKQMPYTTLTGQVLDSGDYRAMLEQAAHEFDYDTKRMLQKQRRAHGELVGVGIALYVEPCGQGHETASIRRLSANAIEVCTGASDQGQGHARLFAGIVAGELEVDPAVIRVLPGDSDRMPEGIGALASRSTAIGGSAVLQAAREIKALQRAGQAWPIEVTVRYEAPMEAWSAGCVMIQVAIERSTGELQIEAIQWVDDCGRMLDEPGALGQLQGGLAQGLGQALFEQVVYDDSGQLLSGSLMDYGIPRASDVPVARISSLGSTTQANLLGVKGVGEAGCIGVPAALLNAAQDAIAPWSDIDLRFPLSCEQLWRAIHAPQRS